MEADMPATRISVVVPVCNEAENILTLTAEIDHAMTTGGHAYEIIFVDDGSSDHSRDLLLELARQNPAVRPLFHPCRRGQSAALLTGIRRATHPLIVTLDGDGQNDPADINRLLTRYLQMDAPAAGIMVSGHRHRRHDTAWRRFSSRIANAVRARLLGDDTPDSGCGIKLFPRELFLRLPSFNHMHRFLPALAIRSGAAVVSVPVNHRERHRGRSHYGTLDRLGAGIIDLLGVLWLMHRACDTVVDPSPRESFSAGDEYAGETIATALRKCS
jgi:dolichol-phosphate mannosyltransferase